MANILVVDDEALITMQLEERLSAMGYKIAGMAASGEEAVEKVRRLKPDLVLMDIVMPGKLNGIEAAELINNETAIPVIFVTSYADDTVIKKAKNARPYGYIVKPFNVLELKAAIEVALARREAEGRRQKMRKPAVSPADQGAETVGADGEEQEFIDIPELKTILLDDIFRDLTLFLYTDPELKESVIKYVIGKGIENKEKMLFAYSKSTVRKYFLKEIRQEDLITHRMKKDEGFTLPQVFADACGPPAPTKTVLPLRIIFDFSQPGEYDDILTIKDAVLARKETGFPVSGIIMVNIGKMDHGLINPLSRGIAKVIVSTGEGTSLSFSTGSFTDESISIVPQATVDEIVKKSLEPVVLSLLDKPISGYGIVNEIHNQYKVLIPQARIYSLLYDLEQKGYLEMRTSGKSKLYSPTENGKKYINHKLSEFNFIFRHMLGGGLYENKDSSSTN